MSDDKVVPIKQKAPAESVVETIERVAGVMKEAPADAYKSGLLITMGPTGFLEYTPLGTAYDNVELLGMLQVANQLILDDMIG